MKRAALHIGLIIVGILGTAVLIIMLTSTWDFTAHRTDDKEHKETKVTPTVATIYASKLNQFDIYKTTIEGHDYLVTSGARAIIHSESCQCK